MGTETSAAGEGAASAAARGKRHSELNTIPSPVCRVREFVKCQIRLVWAAKDGKRDRLRQRRFQFVPVLDLPTFFVYTMRLDDCQRRAKVQVRLVPHGLGMHRATKSSGLILR